MGAATQMHQDEADRPRLTAEEAALAARIVRGEDEPFDPDNSAHEALAEKLDTIANFN